MTLGTPPPMSKTEQDMGASFGPGSHASHEAPSGLRPSGFDPSRVSLPSIFAAMNRRAEVRAEWLRTLPEGHPMRVIADLRLQAACFLTRQTDHDRIALMKAVDAAKEIEEEAFAQWRCDSDGSPKGGDACGSVHDGAGRRHRPTPSPES